MGRIELSGVAEGLVKRFNMKQNASGIYQTGGHSIETKPDELHYTRKVDSDIPCWAWFQHGTQAFHLLYKVLSQYYPTQLNMLDQTKTNLGESIRARLREMRQEESNRLAYVAHFELTDSSEIEPLLAEHINY